MNTTKLLENKNVNVNKIHGYSLTALKECMAKVSSKVTRNTVNTWNDIVVNIWNNYMKF